MTVRLALPSRAHALSLSAGKALCLLTKTDLGERCPGAGDVLHNVLQMLVRDAQLLTRCLPSSPVTPTSRHFPPLPGHPGPHAGHGAAHRPAHGQHPLSPAHTHPPPTPNWSLLVRGPGGELSPGTPGCAPAPGTHADRGGGGGGGGAGHPGLPPLAPLAPLAHLMGAGNSVTLSPAPSLDSQSGSPQHPLEHGPPLSSFPLLSKYSWGLATRGRGRGAGSPNSH